MAALDVGAQPWREAVTYRRVAVAAIVVWCAVMLTVRRTGAITDDWQGWRQADTQAIARNLAFEEFAPLEPRIDWRGDGPGYVETEAQIYPALTAVAMRLWGESVWPAQLLSLVCVAAGLIVVAVALARRYGDAAACGALLVMLGHQGTIAMSTSIQPDALSFAAFAVGWVAFVSYLETPSRRRLVWWVAATAIAGLVKPTTLELGIAQFVLVVLTRRHRDPWIWLGWAVVVTIVAAFMVYARTLFVDYGNTFGVLSGGDSKLPATAMVLAPSTWTELARYSVVWGVGVAAVPASIALAWRRRLEPTHLALATGALVLVVVALRYTSGSFGTHYHLPHVVLGGSLVAAALQGRRASWVLACAMVAIVMGGRGLRLADPPPQRETVLGERLAQLAPPGTLVAVRARAESFNPEWRTVNNFEDPRVFYVSRTRGWVLPNDLAGASRLNEVTQRGAQFYVHVTQKPIDAELAAWLAAHATRVHASPEGEIYSLRTQ
jgi:hypothetical protein